MSLSVATTSSVLRDDLFRERARNDHDAVAVAEEVVAGRDRHAADRDRLAVAVGNPALDDVGRREERAEHRKALLEHEIGVARAAVDDVAQHAARLRASAPTARPSARPRDCWAGRRRRGPPARSASSVHQPSSVSWRDFVRSMCPETVHTGPASRVPGAIALISGGSTMLSWPIMRSTSCTAPV